MEKEFVPYEQALALKELGFDEPCIACYDKLNMLSTYSKNVFEPKNYNTSGYCVSAPLYQQAFRWFREKYNLIAEPYTIDTGAIEYCFQIRDLYSEKYIHDNFIGARYSYSGTFNTYEEAQLECLKKLIEICKKQYIGIG